MLQARFHLNSKSSSLYKGVLLSLIGYLCLAIASACGKALPSQISVFTLVFFQFLICFVLTAPQLLKKGFINLKTSRLTLMLFRAIMGILATLCLFYAIRYIPLVDAVLLQNSAPLFVPFVLLLWMRKSISLKLWLTILIGFAGVVLILKPTTGILNPASWTALIAGVLTAITLSTMQKLKTTEPTNRILFYYFFLGLIVLGPYVFTHWVSPTMDDWLILLGIGVFMYLAQFFITHAFAYGQAHVLAPLSYSAVIFSGLLGWALWHHVPDKLALIGIVLVIAGGMATIVLEKQKQIAEAEFIRDEKI